MLYPLCPAVSSHHSHPRNGRNALSEGLLQMGGKKGIPQLRTYWKCSKDRTQGPTRRNRGVSDGGCITTFGLFHTFRKPCVARGAERRTLPLLGLGRVCSRRTQKAFGTAMRLCASLSRGVAAPLGCVIFLQFGDVAVFSLCAQYFLNVRGGGYHYPRCALRVVETLDGRLSKRLTCRFFGLTGSSLIPVAQKQKRHLTANSPDPRERNRSCFCVTSWSVPGTRRSARGCRWRRGRSGHRPRPG